MNIERRHFTRIHFDAGARLILPGHTLDIRVLDLSFKGALIEVPNVQPPLCGTECVLTIPLAGEDDEISMTVEVAHAEGHRAGLLCRSIDLDSVTHLRQLIQLNLGDSALLERELKALTAN